MPGMDDMKNAGPFFDNELSAIYPMEMHQWNVAAALTPAPGSPAYEVMDTYWAQGVAAGHLRDAKLAAAALASFDQSVKALKSSPYANFAPGIDVKRDEIVGWKAFAEDQPDAAVAAMRKAADQQDKLGQEEVDIPAREMLGDLLLLDSGRAVNRCSKRFAVSRARCDKRCLELLPEGDIWACREELCEAYTCVTGPYREPAAPFSFRSLPLFPRMSHFSWRMRAFPDFFRGEQPLWLRLPLPQLQLHRGRLIQTN
jgi:hypothetical protein